MTQQEHDFGKAREKILDVEVHCRKAFVKVENEYVTKDAVAASELQVQSFAGELQTMMSVIADLNARYVELSSNVGRSPPPSAPPGVESFQIGTGPAPAPAPTPVDAFQNGQDPWAHDPWILSIVKCIHRR